MLSSSWIVLGASAYGLSSFCLAQTYDFKILLCFTLFPLLFGLFERSYFDDTNCFMFVILLSCLLIVTPQHALPIWSVLFVFNIISVCTRKIKLSNALSCSVFLLFAFLLAAFRTFSYLSEQATLDALQYQGFFASYAPFVWFSRLFTGSSTAIALSSANGFNITFGLFFLLLCFVYFFSYKLFKKEYSSDVALLIFLAACMTFSPLRYIVTFGQTSAETVSFSYLFVFLCLCISMKALGVIKDLSAKQAGLSCISYLALIALTFIFAPHNFMQISKYTILFFAIAYAALLASYTMSKGKINPSLLLTCLIVVELCLNAFICTNYNLIPTSCDASDQYDVLSPLLQDTTTQEASAESDTDNTSSQNEYNDFINSHRDIELEAMLVQLNRVTQLAGDSVDFTNDSLYPTTLDRANETCHFLGIKENLLEPIDIDINFTPSKHYSFSRAVDEAPLYSIERLNFDEDFSPDCLVTYRIKPETSLSQCRVLITSNLDGLLPVFEYNGAGAIYAKLLIPAQNATCKIIKFSAYVINDAVLKQLSSRINAYTSQAVSRITTVDYVGLIISCITFMLFILCIMRRKLFFETCFKKAEALADKLLSSKLCRFVCSNYMYILAFLIPSMIYICSLILVDCKPFGSNSILDQDGLGLTLPSFMDAYYNLKKGNTYVSLNGGYGYSLFSTNPLIHLTLFYKLLPATAIEPLILLGEGFCLGLCGFFMAYYLTHRCNRRAAFKKHPLLLFSSCIYALNAYMLSMHGFTGWYFFYMLVPLVILSLDYLIYQKRLAPYIITLTLCMMINIYLALYLCLFLIIWFFTYRFTGLKDFLSKGIRFALCSILCAGNSIFVIASIYFGTSFSNYKDQDSIFPKPGLHTNYLNILKQQMVFPATTAITNDDGYVSSYFGIITLLLLMLFILRRGVKLSEKLRRLIPIAILYWCFNGKIMSYIWNGFHYQSKVPNRYAFLLMFMIAELTYDVLIRFKASDKMRILISSIVISVAFIGCKLYNEDISTVSFAFSIVFITIYVLCVFLYSKRKRCMQLAMTCILIAELTANVLYTTKHYDYTAIHEYGNYTEIAHNINEGLMKDNTFSRIQFPAHSVYNGALYNAASVSLFNSFVNLYQTNTNSLYGYLSAVNFTRSNHIGSLFGNMLSATEYIMYPYASNEVNNDLTQYEYIGDNGRYYVFKNPRKVSLGFYLPSEALTHQDKLNDAETLWNHMLHDYTDNKDILLSKHLAYSTKPNTWNRFYFTDSTDKVLSPEKVQEQILDYNLNSNSSSYSYPSIRLHVDFIADTDGFAYIAPNEYIALKEVKEGEHVSLDINYPNTSYLPSDTLQLVTENIDSLNQLYNQIVANQLENIIVHDNMIEGTVDYEKDGYTFYSLAYDKSWHAYIDGEEVEVEDPYYSCLAVKTPAGKHTITLKYIPYGMWPSKFISLGFIILSIIYCFIYSRYQRRKNIQINYLQDSE